MSIAIDVIGGLALFLLAMSMMTEGLTLFAGGGLRQLLARWTSTPLRGVAAGILLTGLVQSSSAVTVATIGFVNAGALTLRQALGVIFGTNVGTTMTGWLVSLVGFGFRIELLALPILAVGVALRVTAPAPRWRGLGEALAGFGLFFLGLSLLKDAFAGIAADYGASVLAGGEGGSTAAFMLVGFVATVLTQSSSAAIAIILSAAAGGVLGMPAAAAAVIGANLGTTSTAALAVVRATPAARRLALGHIAFNLLTAAVALAILPLLLWTVAALADGLDLEQSPAATLALFHSVFNLLGVAIMLPLAGRLASLLERVFRRADEELARPRFLDATLSRTPVLAVAALREELLRLRGMAVGVSRESMSGDTPGIERRIEAAGELASAIARFARTLRTGTMSDDVASDLAAALETAHLLRDAARQAPLTGPLHSQARASADRVLSTGLSEYLAVVQEALASFARPGPPIESTSTAARREVEEAYRRARALVLNAAVGGRLAVEDIDATLDSLAALRRGVRRLAKADRWLARPAGEAASPGARDVGELGAAG